MEWSLGSSLAAAAGAYALYRALRFVRSDCDQALAACADPPVAAKRFDGQVVWVTGATSGIGEALAHAFAAHGARLVLSARRRGELERVCADLDARFGDGDARFRFVVLDVADLDAVAKAAAEAEALFGRIDILANNAGIGQRSFAVDTPLDVDKEVMQVNFFGAIAVIKAVLPGMLRRKNGLIINSASIVSKIGSPLRSVYSASKSALLVWSDAVRLEILDSGVRILNVLPGPVSTQFSVNCLTKSGERFGKVLDHGGKSSTMSSERCAQLILRAAAAKHLTEIWVSPHPYLAFLYMAQYAPRLGLLVAPPVVKKQVAAFRKASEEEE